jgi:hypothetical protein
MILAEAMMKVSYVDTRSVALRLIGERERELIFTDCG